MTASTSALFFSSAMEIQLPGANISTQGLVSAYGVSRMLFSVSMLEQIKQAAESAVQLKLGDKTFSIQLVQQFTEQGMSYCARFQGLTAEQAMYLAERIQRERVAATHARKRARVPVKILQDEPHPRQASFPWAGKDQMFDVITFNNEGIRLAKAGELESLKVGRALRLAITDTEGRTLTGLEAEVRNFSILRNQGGEISTEVGLRFLETGSAAREGYQALVRNCLLALAKRSGH